MPGQHAWERTDVLLFLRKKLTFKILLHFHRNKNVPVNHRDFWYATYTLYSVSEKTENEEKMSDNASASSGSDQGPSSRQHTMVSFLKPVLKQIIMAGKSMQLLKNLQCAESTTCQATARGSGSLPHVSLSALGLLLSLHSCHPEMHHYFVVWKLSKAFIFMEIITMIKSVDHATPDWKKIVLIGNFHHYVWKAVRVSSTCIFLTLDSLGPVL